MTLTKVPRQAGVCVSELFVQLEGALDCFSKTVIEFYDIN